MIEGVTKPFALDRPPLPETEKRAAAAAYIAGMKRLFERFGPGNLDLDFIETGTPVTNVLLLDFSPGSRDTDPGGLIAHAPDSQFHIYGIDHEGVLRRTDSQVSSALGSQVPPPERFGRSRKERFLQSIQQSQREQELGINSAPVDTEEVRNLFAIIDREYPA